jgi:UDP-N-acetylglucosamine/UDP-N-acetylgalactosamine diphosphorylase
MRNAARERGLEELRAGRVAVVIAAGGQGTRLGSPAPKGMWPVGPASGKPLLQWQAEKVLHWARELGRRVPLIVMVSDATLAKTQSFLRWHGHFGLDPTWVRTPCQPSLPPLDDDGRMLLASPSRIAMSPNGHGGIYQTLQESGLLDLLADHGIRTLSYVQVDNALVHPLDPLFLGFHQRMESLISSKSVLKTRPEEKVGVFARVNDRYAIVEYSELTEEQAHEVNTDGTLTFGHGSIAAHCIDLGFAQRIAEQGLPYHRAQKKVPHVDGTGAPVAPTEPNATKFERFLFDAIPLAPRSMVMETRRWEEFSPLKNADGEDSPATVRRDLEGLFRGWHERADLPVPDGALEVNPVEAPDERAFRLLHGLPPQA